MRNSVMQELVYHTHVYMSAYMFITITLQGIKSLVGEESADTVDLPELHQEV